MVEQSKHRLMVLAAVLLFGAIGLILLQISKAAPGDVDVAPMAPVPIADTNGDNIVNIFDLSYMLSRWNTADTSADVTGDGLVNIFDLSRLLSQWGRDDTQVTEVPYQVERVVDGLAVPWSLAFTSVDRWLVTERDGDVRVIIDEVLQPQPLITFEEARSASEEGLLGITLDPDYTTNKYVYACYSYQKGTEVVDRVVRFRDQLAFADGLETVIDDIPAAKWHAGCRLGFGPDGMLYITTGDATDGAIAQDLNSLGGKFLRVHADGSIPADNPFPGSPIWTYGHRNSQGFDWHPVHETLVATEHGPSGFDGPGGGDEVNIIEPGKNYGWPEVSHQDMNPLYEPWLLEFTPAIAPGGATFYSGTMFPQFANNYFFAVLRGEGLYRVVLSADDPTAVEQYERISDINVGRVRDVVEGPDGYIYFLSSNSDNRGNPDPFGDAIYRLVPAQ